MPFIFGDQMAHVSNKLWTITSITGAAICFIILLLIALVSLSQQSRRMLDRVSFRMLVVTLIANMIYAITNAIGGSFTGPTWSCGFTIWLLQASLRLSSFLTFCIALNLQLVLVHGLDGQRLERIYFLVSATLASVLTVPAYVSKQYGWDADTRDCWYSNPSKEKKLAWQVGTQLFWTLATVAGEFVSALVVHVYMHRHKRRAPSTISTKSHSGASPFSLALPTRNRSQHHDDDTQSYDSRLHALVFRIWLYPVASGIINAISVALVFVGTTDDGVHNSGQYAALLFNDFLYGARAIVYGLLASTDPALLRALHHLYRRWRPAEAATRQLGFGSETTVSISRRNDHPSTSFILPQTDSLKSYGDAQPTQTQSVTSAPFDIITSDTGGFVVTPAGEVPGTSHGSGRTRPRPRSRSVGRPKSTVFRPRSHRSSSFAGLGSAGAVSGIQVQIELTSVSMRDDDLVTPGVDFGANPLSNRQRMRENQNNLSRSSRPGTGRSSRPGTGRSEMDMEGIDTAEDQGTVRSRRTSRVGLDAASDRRPYTESARGELSSDEVDCVGREPQTPVYSPKTFDNSPVVESRTGTQSSEIPSHAPPFATAVVGSLASVTSAAPLQVRFPRLITSPISPMSLTTQGHGSRRDSEEPERESHELVYDLSFVSDDPFGTETNTEGDAESGRSHSGYDSTSNLKSAREKDAERRRARRQEREREEEARRARQEQFMRTL